MPSRTSDSLREADFGVRHYWLVWARPEEILEHRELFGDWILATALQSASDELLSKGRPASPERRALAMRRRKPRQGRHSIQNCLRGIREAFHPQLRLAWILLLIENHRERADLELIHLIGAVQPSTLGYGELAAAAAWGLAQLGREALFELGDRFRKAPGAVKEFFCQALWHMGLQARGCELWLGDYDSPWTRALLYRLEAHGWQQLLARRAWPLWIDRASLAALASLAFSLEPEERWYALLALQGWGPAFAQVEELIEALTRDPNPTLAKGARLVSEYLNHHPDATDPTELARKLGAEEPEAAGSITSKFRARPTTREQHRLLRAFYEVPLPVQLEILKAIQTHGIPDEAATAWLLDMIQFAHIAPIRVAALHAYAKLANNTTVLKNTLRYDPSPELRQAAADHLVKVVSPEFLLEHLDRPEILKALQSEPHLLRALTQWPPQQFEELLERLKELGYQSLLEHLELNVIQWSNFEHFTPTQNSVAAALIRHHRKLPDFLVEEVAQGRLHSPTLLQLWEDYPPEIHRCRGLAQMLVRLPSHQRMYARLALSAQGEAGARALAEILKASEVEVALRAAQELADWLQAPQWALPEWLETCPHPEVVQQLADWLAPVFLPPYRPLNRAWAKVLLPRLDNTQLRPQGPVDDKELQKLGSKLLPHILRWKMRYQR